MDNKKLAADLLKIVANLLGDEGEETTSATLKKVSDVVSPYKHLKAEVTIEATGESVMLRDERRRLPRSTFCENLVKQKPGISWYEVRRQALKAYPDMSSSGLSSYMSNATNGTGPYSGRPVFILRDGGLYLR